jgi:hypothetical protein
MYQQHDSSTEAMYKNFGIYSRRKTDTSLLSSVSVSSINSTLSTLKKAIEEVIELIYQSASEAFAADSARLRLVRAGDSFLAP